MARPTTFDQALEAIEGLPDDLQAELVELVRRRLAERGREQVIEDVRQARREFAEGRCEVATVEDLLREIQS